MATSFRKYLAGILLTIIPLLIGCAGNRPDSFSEQGNGIPAHDVESLLAIIEQQGEQIETIHRELLNYQKTLTDQDQVLDIYDENNQNVREFRKKLENEVQAVLEEFQSKSIYPENTLDNDITNTLIKMQNKIEILEDRTFYTDSLYFSIMNDIVLVENKISSLISSFKEMDDLSAYQTTTVIPKISDEEYTAKYIESLANYQNAEWDLSLNGFNYLIHIDRNHDLADNCQYWIGEVYYALNDYRRSIKEFEKVYSFPGTNKADDAQFKMGLCYINIGQIEY